MRESKEILSDREKEGTYDSVIISRNRIEIPSMLSRMGFTTCRNIRGIIDVRVQVVDKSNRHIMMQASIVRTLGSISCRVLTPTTSSFVLRGTLRIGRIQLNSYGKCIENHLRR